MEAKGARFQQAAGHYRNRQSIVHHSLCIIFLFLSERIEGSDAAPPGCDPARPGAALLVR